MVNDRNIQIILTSLYKLREMQSKFVEFVHLQQNTFRGTKNGGGTLGENLNCSNVSNYSHFMS
jgi:hypothetical protein